MSQFATLDTVRTKGDEWLTKLEEKLDTQMLEIADKFPETWNNTQAVAGCCGWSIIEATDDAATGNAAAGTTTISAGTNDAGATDSTADPTGDTTAADPAAATTTAAAGATTTAAGGGGGA